MKMLETLQNLWMQYIYGPISNDPYWELTAFVGEVLFGGRFILQWIVSEKEKKSTVPTGFWYMSVAGTLVLLTYFIHIRKPVLIITAVAQLGIYLRNLQFIHRDRRASAVS
jgi:lipid-A-disaccharide synthase-like uncharacterized protein